MVDDLRALRRKMNYDAIDAENLRVSRNTLDNMQKQVMLWDRPERNKAVSKETVLTIKGGVDGIIDIVNNKIAVVNKLILERRGDLKDIMNNMDFINKYNKLIEPLITKGIDREKQNAIETNLQLIEGPVSELAILLKKLMNDNEFIDFSRIEGVFNAFSIYKNVENQINRGNYYMITPERIKSMQADYIGNLNEEGIRLLDMAKIQANLPPGERVQAYIDEMGPISRGDMAKLKRMYGEPIEKLGKDLGKELKSTRQMFKDVMKREGGLTRDQIELLTDVVDEVGNTNEKQMQYLTNLYGRKSAELIRQIKLNGEMTTEDIRELGRDIGDHFKSTRQMFKDVMRSEGKLNRNQIDNLGEMLSEEGEISQAQMRELINLYGEKSAEMIKQIKESGDLTEDSIKKLANTVSSESKSTRQMFKDVMRSEGKLNRTQIENLADMLSEEGEISQAQMNELIRTYGENSAELIKNIKETGNLTDETIKELAQTIADEGNATRGQQKSTERELKAKLEEEGLLNRNHLQNTIKEEGLLNRKQFQDIMLAEGKLKSAEIENLTKILEMQGELSRGKYDELAGKYGENVAEVVKAIKEEGAITQSTIRQLAEVIKIAKEVKAEEGEEEQDAITQAEVDKLPPPPYDLEANFKREYDNKDIVPLKKIKTKINTKLFNLRGRDKTDPELMATEQEWKYINNLIKKKQKEKHGRF